jgi:hypothetical protein
MWQVISQDSSDALFTVTAPKGSIIELDVDATHPNQMAPLGATITSAPSGGAFYGSLDTTSSSNVIQPQGLTWHN